MSRQSITLFSHPEPVITYTGPPVRVDSWYTSAQHLHTVSIVAANCRGRLTIQASIKASPSENDWFPISLGGQLYIDYPRSGLWSASDNFGAGPAFGALLGGEISTLGFSFTGRFVWMRAILDRSRIVPPGANPVMIGACGYIDRILLNI